MTEGEIRNDIGWAVPACWPKTESAPCKSTPTIESSAIMRSLIPMDFTMSIGGDNDKMYADRLRSASDDNRPESAIVFSPRRAASRNALATKHSMRVVG